MILCCERCDARYAVDDGRLGKSGRKVRCTSCGHVWHQKSPEEADGVRPGVAPEFHTEPAAGTPQAKPKEPEVVAVRRFGARAAVKAEAAPKSSSAFRKHAQRIMAMALPTAALVACVIMYRGALIEMWPPVARLYAMIGVDTPATAPGLAIRGVRMAEQTTDGHRTVIVEGEVANTGTEAHPLPRLHATLADGGDAKARWSFDAGPTELAPGQAVSFHTQLDNAPAGARSVSVGLWR